MALLIGIAEIFTDITFLLISVSLCLEIFVKQAMIYSIPTIIT